MSILYLQHPISRAQLATLVAGLSLICASFWFPSGAFLRNSGGGLIGFVILFGVNRALSAALTAWLSSIISALGIGSGIAIRYDRTVSQILSCGALLGMLGLIGLYLHDKKKMTDNKAGSS